MDLLDDLRATFADRSAHSAVEWRGRAYSYGELERRALAAAAVPQECAGRDRESFQFAVGVRPPPPLHGGMGGAVRECRAQVVK